MQSEFCLALKILKVSIILYYFLPHTKTNQLQSSNLQGTHLSNVDTFLCFKVTIRCANLYLSVISNYQYILHDKVK